MRFAAFTASFAMALALSVAAFANPQAPADVAKLATDDEAAAAVVDEGASPDDKHDSPDFAFVVLNTSKMPSVDEVQKALAASFPEKTKISGIEVEERTISATVNDCSVIATRATYPIPWKELEGPCKASWLWPDATAKMKDHMDHLIVVVQSEKGTQLERSLVLTKAMAALTRCSDSAGIYWGHGPVVLGPELFQRFADRCSKELPPAMAWIGLLRSKSEDGKLTLATTGMDYFGKMDLEVVESDKSPKEIMFITMGVATMVLAGEEFEDGDTVGPDEKEKIKVRYSDSVFDREEKVMRIEY